MIQTVKLLPTFYITLKMGQGCEVYNYVQFFTGLFDVWHKNGGLGFFKTQM